MVHPLDDVHCGLKRTQDDTGWETVSTQPTSPLSVRVVSHFITSSLFLDTPLPGGSLGAKLHHSKHVLCTINSLEVDKCFVKAFNVKHDGGV